MAGEDTIQALARMGATVTSGPVPADFEAGWGHPPMSRGKMIAHHWTKTHTEPDYTGFRSACGLLTVATKRVPLCGAGNLPFCVRCENKLMKQPTNGQKTA